MDTPETDVDLIRALYQTRRKEVLYAEILLATGQSAPSASSSSSGGSSTYSGTGGFDGGGGIIITPSCFATEGLIKTPHGLFNFRETYDRFTRGARKVYSFSDKGEIETDYIKNIWHHKAKCLKLVFEDNKTVKATPEHLIFPAFGQKKAVGDFKLGDTNLFFTDSWRDLRLLDVIEGVEEEEVWNMRVLKNKNYIINDLAASNLKAPDVF